MTWLFALVIGGSLWLSAWQVDAAGTIILYACSSSTCKRIEKGSEHYGFVLAREVYVFRQVPGCPNCCRVAAPSGKGFVALGACADLACRFWGGDHCKARSK